MSLTTEWLIILILCVIVLILAILKIKADRQRDENLQKARVDSLNSEVKRLTRQLMVSQEAERKAIAGLLHDEIGSFIAGINDQMSIIKDNSRDEMVLDSADAVLHTTRYMHSMIRDMILKLRPPVLDKVGLVSALSEHIEQYQRRNPQIKVEVNIVESLEDLDKDLAIVIFRMIQECLTNISKHAKAEAVFIDITNEDDAIIKIRVMNDGAMENNAKRGTESGLWRISESCEGFGGFFRVVRKNDVFIVECEIPQEFDGTEL